MSIFSHEEITGTNPQCSNGKRALGVDIGSVYLSLALVDDEGRVVDSLYKRHHGHVMEALETAVRSLKLSGNVQVSCTGTGAEQLSNAGPYLDSVVSLLHGAKSFLAGVRNVLYVGAGSFHLIHTNDEGDYVRHTSNTACASGTGAFLDQQAMRIGLEPDEFHRFACDAESCPSVAARCAVFAKTDIIHLQQEGRSANDIASGICKGMADSTLDVLLKGRRLEGETVVVGGVANNTEIIRHIEKRIGFAASTIESPELVGAIGAALHAMEQGATLIFPWKPEKLEQGDQSRIRRPSLALEKSEYPAFENFYAIVNEDGTEVSVPKAPLKKTFDVVLGIDVGSTSTKGVVIDQDGAPVITIYRPTGGEPIRATQLLLKGICEAADKFELELNVIAAATTGSGRKLVGKVIGADLKINEITAHARAAIEIDPLVDTILEIGGQDAKFTQLTEGRVSNSVMNHVCAAGTGSFIEEQAKKLKISLTEYGDTVLGIAPPRTSDRCTVFMERDLDVLLSQGWSRDEVAAAVLYSVCDNYLNKVVAGQHVGDHVYFQGATARNKALVAAFEQVLDKPITVSPMCHLTGALGAALLLMDKSIERTSFRGLNLAGLDLSSRKETCELCRNVCEMTVVDVAGESVGWGAKCGREYEDLVIHKPDLSKFALFRLRERLMHECSGQNPDRPRLVVGMPRSLATYGYLPLWGTFLRELGVGVRLSKVTSESTMKRGVQLAQSEFCAPVMASHGHVAELLESDCDLVFLPHMIRAPGREHSRDSQFCPYVQSHPSVIKSALGLGEETNRIVSPIIDLNNSPKDLSKELFAVLGDKLKCTLPEVQEALASALHAQDFFQETLVAEGEKCIAGLEAANEMGIVVFGRPYNVNDPGVNVDLAKKIAGLGITVIPVDCVAEAEMDPRWNNVYWNYGQAILRVAKRVAESPNLFGVFFSNFSCGPDSYILTYFKAIMEDMHKPFLTVQFDAHGADAGYVTRVEAALESFRSWKPQKRETPAISTSESKIAKDRLVFLPPMDPLGVRFFAAAFEREGYRAEPLRETDSSMDVGHRHVMGGECAPCPSTIGSFIHTVESRGLRPDQVALFMPTASGPCRFGQYAALDRLILNKRGWKDVQLMSPSAGNAYCGLPSSLRLNLYRAIVCSDIINKLIFRIRPYEEIEGVTDLLAEESILKICDEFRSGNDLRSVLEGVVEEFSRVVINSGQRPKIGIVGEIYVRNSSYLNQDAVGWIERLGGEAMRTSIAEWIIYTSYLQLHLHGKGKFQPLKWVKNQIADRLYHRIEHDFYSVTGSVLADRMEPPIDRIIELGKKYVPLEFEGESILTVGRALHFIEEEQVDAVLNLAPNFCMPGTTTSAILAKIEHDTGVPVISNFYDGSGRPNLALRPHLQCLAERRENGVISTDR